MQAGRVHVDPWAADGVGSGWAAGVANVVRVLTAVVLLGLAVLIAVLVGQGAAAARTDPRTQQHPRIKEPSLVQPARGGGADPGRTAAYLQAVAAADGLVDRLAGPLPPAGAADGGGDTRSRPTAPDRPGSSGTGSAMTTPDWRGWTPKRPQVAAAILPADDDRGRGRGDGFIGDDAGSAALPLQVAFPVRTVTLAQAQQPSTVGSHQLDKAVLKLLSDADNLNSWMVSLTGDRVDPESGQTPSQIVEATRSRVRSLLLKVPQRDMPVAAAPAWAQGEVKEVTAGIRKLGQLANGTADTVAGRGGQLQRAAREALTAGEHASVHEAMTQVAARASSLSELVSETIREIAPDRPYLDPHHVAGLAKVVGQYADGAKAAAAANEPETMQAEMTVAIDTLRELSEYVEQRGGSLVGVGATVRATAEAAAEFADSVEADIPKRGGQTPSRPQDAPSIKGAEVEPPPSLDAPVDHHAGGEPASPAVTGATGQDEQVASMPTVAETLGGGDHASGAPPVADRTALLTNDVAAPPAPVSQPIASASTGDSGSSDGDNSLPFDNGMFAEVADPAFTNFTDFG
jgi:hypothetical protein